MTEPVLHETFYQFSLCDWIFENLIILTKSAETSQKWLKQCVFMKKLSLAYPAPILVLLQNVQDFTYGAFMGFICGIFVHLATPHIA